MASDARHQAADLTHRLLDRGDRFSFFQAYRLLRLLAKREGLEDHDAIRVRPNLSLGFPQTDLESIQEQGQHRYRVTANFLGLYGVDSPLPTFYTEDLLNEQADGYGVNREFLDIFAQSIYPMLFEAWIKARPALRIVEYGDRRMLEILFAFVGIEKPGDKFSQPGIESLLVCGALYNQQNRTAEGLKAVLKTSFPNTQAEVKQLQTVWVPIAQEQCFRLGQQACFLGEDAHLGNQCKTLDGITIVLADLSIQSFTALMPGGNQYERLRFLVDYYLIEPYPVRVELRLREGEASTARMASEHWSRLGADTWLTSGITDDQTGTSFSLRLREPLERMESMS
jgi:type VI secretion system protein ImpH